MKSSEFKRLFFGFEVVAPWPTQFPHGRLLEEPDRHFTLIFLGNTDYTKLSNALPAFPTPPFIIGPTGQFDQCQFLPAQYPRLVAWHIDWLEECSLFDTYYSSCIDWLKAQGFVPHERGSLLPHVTLCRAPFNLKQWKKNFSKLPLIISSLHLYESLGHSKYASCWKYPFICPFEEVDHTADIAFLIHGENLRQLHKNAFVALAFKFPPFLDFYSTPPQINSLEDIIIHLNHAIALADGTIGCPFKAVSYHGEIIEKEYFTWEMIVDV